MKLDRMDPPLLETGTEHFEEFPSEAADSMVVLYRYRRRNGELFRCAHYGLDDCRRALETERGRPGTDVWFALEDLDLDRGQG